MRKSINGLNFSKKIFIYGHTVIVYQLNVLGPVLGIKYICSAFPGGSCAFHGIAKLASTPAPIRAVLVMG